MNNEAKKLFQQLGSVHLWAYTLTGSGAKKTRQQLMSALTGKKLPAAKCGINALRAEVISQLRISTTGKCYAEIYDEIDQLMKEEVIK